jgi:hypothetical protein
MKVTISKRLVAINSASTVARHLVSITVLVWLQQYLIRRIPAEEYSLLSIVMAVIVFAPLLSTVLTGGISRYVSLGAGTNWPFRSSPEFDGLYHGQTTDTIYWS